MPAITWLSAEPLTQPITCGKATVSNEPANAPHSDRKPPTVSAVSCWIVASKPNGAGLMMLR